MWRGPRPGCSGGAAARYWAGDLAAALGAIRLGVRRQKARPAVAVALGIATVVAIAGGAYVGALVERWFRMPSSAALTESLAEYAAYLGREPPALCAASRMLCLTGHATKRVLQLWRHATGRPQLSQAVAPPRCPHQLVRIPRNDTSGGAGSARCAPIRLFFDSKVYQWFGNAAWLTERAVGACGAKCSLARRPEAADVVVFNLAVSMGAVRPAPHQMRAVLNMEAHSVRRQLMADTDLFVSFHQEADVQVSYAYTLVGNTPCRKTNRTAACLQKWGDAWCRECQPSGDGSSDGASATQAFSDGASATQAFSDGASATQAFLQASLNYIPALLRASEARSQPLPAARAPVAVFMSATCERHDRYLQRLMRHIQVDSYGGCYRNKDESQHPAFDLLRSSADVPRGQVKPADRYQAKMLISATYKFYLSIENTILPDYITEKFYHGFMTPAIMVYLGAPNARQYAPANRSFIDALDFESPEHLAAFLHRVAAEPALYRSYSDWRRFSFLCAVKSDLTLMDSGSVMCRICEAAARHSRPLSCQ